MNLIEELRWRGMIADIMPGTEEQLLKEMTTGYVGFDPTADSLHIGSLVPILLLVHLQKAGHKPIALVGGATGLIGDPSGKKEERKLLTEDEVNHNVECIRQQLSLFLDFTSGNNAALLVNNADWFKNISTIAFLRDAGKYLTVSYLLSKGFIKDRMAQDQEISFTEFNYILMQAYDFMWLYQQHNCRLQMGGSDQWGNITAGAELIRKKLRGEGFAFTCPLITKADGGKFGKTEKGNVWLDPQRTSPYQFYQFWLNASDEDAEKWIKIFTLLSKDEVDLILKEHKGNENQRLLQKKLAEKVTSFIHGERTFYHVKRASEFLFGTEKDGSFLYSIDEPTFLNIFESVPTHKIIKDKVSATINIIDFLVDTEILPSKGEARKLIQNGGISINKYKIPDIDYSVKWDDVILEKYITVQKGKKNYYLVKTI
ncbi:MAG TPA: tyrosine--tRNA ligase [Chitinophagaceae bacterium]|nr:tyrosine--tRNA ligase [Chitinophagaceae bacterium]